MDINLNDWLVVLIVDGFFVIISYFRLIGWKKRMLFIVVEKFKDYCEVVNILVIEI